MDNITLFEILVLCIISSIAYFTRIYINCIRTFKKCKNTHISHLKKGDIIMVESASGRGYYAKIIENDSRRSRLKLQVLDFVLEFFPTKVLDASYDDLLLEWHRKGYK